MREPTIGKSKRVHRYQWLWEPLETDPTFLVRPMFGGKSLYLDGKLMLYFTAGEEPWRGVLVCTERDHHAALLAEFPELSLHPILPKWLYLQESANRFESVAEFGLVLRDSPYKSGATLADVLHWAGQATGPDPGGARSEFISLVRRAETILPSQG